MQTLGPKNELRPTDPIENGIHCARVLVGDTEEEYADPQPQTPAETVETDESQG